MTVPNAVLALMANRRDAPAHAVLLHGVWSTGSGWYPLVIVACEPFFAVKPPNYKGLRTFGEVFRHWSVSDREREEQFRRIADEVLSQLADTLETSLPHWNGPRPSILAHSYGAILVYRFMHGNRTARVDAVLLRAAPLKPGLPFDHWSGRAQSLHSLTGGRDAVLAFMPALRAFRLVNRSEAALPPSAAGLGHGYYGPASTSHPTSGLGGGHLVLVDGDLAYTWNCGYCGDNARPLIHTWLVPSWDHTYVERHHVHRYWFPLLLGWQPADWDYYLNCLKGIVPNANPERPVIDHDALSRWLHDRNLEPFWKPERTAAEFIRAAVQDPTFDTDLLSTFATANRDYDRAIAELYVVQAAIALHQWENTPPAPLGDEDSVNLPPPPDPADPRRALLPEALAQLARSLFALWVQRQR